MIFLSVGTQLPFPRLVSEVARIAQAAELDVLAQTAEPDGTYSNIRHQAFLLPSEYDVALEKADVIVAHAGIGIILSAKKFSKPIIIFPRSAALGEHRNDHQSATVKHLTSHTGVYIAHSAEELACLLARTDLAPAKVEASAARDNLVTFLGSYVDAL